MAEGVELKELKPNADSKEQEYTGVIIYKFDNEPDEKPWQRVIYEITRKGTHLYEPVKSVPSTFIIILLGVYILVGFLTQVVEDEMPSIVREVDVGRDVSNVFSEEVAMRYFHEIMGDEPRVSGTKYHLNKTIDMMNIVDRIKAQAQLPIRTDWQMISGNFWLNTSFPMVNYYHNLSNVIALLEGESGFHSNGTIGSTILVNCHYDSVPYALGASDNVVFCAVMAETLRVMARRTQKYKHNIIFLFNGAEENPLQASHAFVQHAWFRGVTVVVNLDAAGMNGKPIVFQVTDTRVLNAYRRRTTRPNAQSLGNFIFSSGIIPSDTDFRIWRDFGGLRGIDIAFIKWGHVYHTRFDHPDQLMPGVMQCSGDMVLNLVSDMADDEDFERKAEEKTEIFYDYLNSFMISYTVAGATVMDVFMSILAFLSVAYYVWLVGPRWSTVQELLFAVLGRLAAMAAGMLACAVIVPIMVATTIQMRYMTYPWIVVPIFWLPYLITSVYVTEAYDAWRVKKAGLNRSIRALQAMSATRLILGVVLLILSFIPATAQLRYVLTVPLLIMSITAMISITVVRYLRLAAWQHLLMEVVFSLPAVMFAFTLALRLNAVILPVMGRSAIDNPDYMVAIINVGLAVLVTSTVSGVELLFSRIRIWIPAGIVAIVCIVFVFLPFEPYHEDGISTQRHYWFHTQITSYDINRVVTESTTGVLVTKHDPYSTDRVMPALREHGYNFNTRTDFDADCENYVYCNLPLYRTSFGRYLKDALFIYTSGPAPSVPRAELYADKNCVGEVCTLNVTIIPSPHNLISIWPRPGVSVLTWSLAPTPQPSFKQLERPVYIIVHSIATYSEVVEPLNIEIRFDVPLALQSQPIVDMSHHAHRIHHPETYTPHYAALIAAMPQYFNIATFMTFRSNYIF